MANYAREPQTYINLCIPEIWERLIQSLQQGVDGEVQSLDLTALLVSVKGEKTFSLTYVNGHIDLWVSDHLNTLHHIISGWS